MKTITRRDVFSLAGGAAALAATGRLPLLGASAMPAAATPVEGYLREHAPAAGPNGPGLLEYAVLRWTQTDPKTGETKNLEIGRLEIERLIGHDVTLKVRQRTAYPRPVNRLEARVTGKDDDWLTLKSWNLKTWIEERDDCVYESEGYVDGSRVHINDGISEYTFPEPSPITICQWSLPIALAAGKTLAGGFAMLEDLTVVRPDQTLAKGLAVEVPYQDRVHKLTSWAHTGQGVLPIHYLLDDNGLPQLMTQGALAWALQKAA